MSTDSKIAVPKPIAKPSDNRLGLMMMFCGMAVFAAGDAVAKILAETLPPIQIVWARQTGLLIGVFFLLAIQGFKILRTNQPKLQISRGVLATISATLFITAIAYVPLADAVAITFVAPFMVTVMAAVFLKEPVGMRRWVAVSIGFLATLIVIRPGLGVIHPAAFLLILAAAAFSCRQILSRALAGGDRPSTTIAYTAIVSWCVMLVPTVFVWQTPTTAREIYLLVAIAAIAAVGETLVILALDAAQAVVVAPVQYSLLVWGTLYGFWIFDQLPDFWTLTGALIIVATGLYTLNRERIVGGGK